MTVSQMPCHLLVRPQSRQALDAALAAKPDRLIVDFAGPDAADVALGSSLIAERLTAAAPRPQLYARIPPFAHASAAERLDAAVKSGVDGILMQGATSGYDATWLDARIAVAEAMHGRRDGEVGMMLEATGSAAAVFGLGSYRGASQRLTGLVFTAAGLAADLGLPPLDADGRWRAPFAHARAQLVLAAAAAGVAAIDATRLGSSADLPITAAVVAAHNDGFTALLTDRVADAEALGPDGIFA